MCESRSPDTYQELNEQMEAWLNAMEALWLRFRVRFRHVSDGLGIYSSDIPDCHRLIEESGLLKTGAVRQIPKSVLEAIETVCVAKLKNQRKINGEIPEGE